MSACIRCCLTRSSTLLYTLESTKTTGHRIKKEEEDVAIYNLYIPYGE